MGRCTTPRSYGKAPDSGHDSKPMSDVVESLILDLVDWVATRERTYEEVMDAWRTSCPRLPVWEDANDRGLVATVVVNGRSIVRVTEAGMALRNARRPAEPPAR